MNGKRYKSTYASKTPEEERLERELYNREKKFSLDKDIRLVLGLDDH